VRGCAPLTALGIPFPALFVPAYATILLTRRRRRARRGPRDRRGAVGEHPVSTTRQ
jgi:hypothetical protein